MKAAGGSETMVGAGDPASAPAPRAALLAECDRQPRGASA